MNINYPDSPNYTNLANLWLQAATEIDQKIETKQNLLNRTTELISRIENVDRSIPHEEISHICDRVLGEFNRLSDENQDSIAKFAATLGHTGYDYLHKLFQTIGDTQHLPNYFDLTAPRNLPLDPLRNLFDNAIGRSIILFKSFTENKLSAAEGITSLGIKIKEQSIALSNKESSKNLTLLNLFNTERGLQEQISSNLDNPSKIAFGYTSKLNLKSKQQQAIIKYLNSSNFHMISEFYFLFPDALIDFLGPENCKQVKHLVGHLFESNALLDRIRQAFPNLVTLQIQGRLDGALKCQKGFELLKNLTLIDGNSDQLDVSSFPHISALGIRLFPELTTIKNAQHFTSLSQLTIDKCPKLDMNFLKDIPSIKEVFIIEATDFNLSGLANNPHVSELILTRPSCQNPNFIFEMPALKHFSCVASPLAPEIHERLVQKGVTVHNW